MPVWIQTVRGAFVKAGAKAVNHGSATLDDRLSEVSCERSAV